MRDKILIILSSVLLAAVVIEGYYLYKINSKVESSSSYYKPASKKENTLLKQLSINQNINPFKEFQQMQENMDKVFGSFNAKFQNNPDFDKFFKNFSISPALDMMQSGNKYVVNINIPGSTKNNIKVSVKDHILKVKAKMQETNNKKGSKYIQKERYIGSFERELTLPQNADESSIKTIYKNGVLTITFDKKN